MSILKNEAFRYALCFDLNQNQLRYAILDPKTKKIVQEEAFIIENFDRDTVEALLNKDFFQYDYHTISLTVSSERNTLVPVDLFNQSQAKEIFKFNYPEPIDNLDYNRIPELSIVSIYEIPIWIKSTFVIKFPRIKIIHSSTILLKGIFNQTVFSPKFHVLWQNNSFYLVITSKSKLEYFNLFESNVISDLVYHILFILQQKNIQTKDIKFQFYGVPFIWDKTKEVSQLLGQNITISANKETAEHYILTNQLLCV